MSLASDYAQALYSAAEKGSVASKKGGENHKAIEPKKLVAQLVKHLEVKGRTKLLPQILHELGRIEAHEEKLAPSVEVAHQKDAAHALSEAAEKYGIHAHAARVNHTLVQGWRASGNGKLYDASAKRQLVDLYKKVLTQ